jgi:hypothetical protein
MNDKKRGKSTHPNHAKDKTRRGVVKGVALGVGGLTLTHWSKPVVENVVLPAHAQTSPGGRINQAGSGGNTLTFG